MTEVVEKMTQAEIEETQKEIQNYLESYVNEYFRFKKNLMIMEIISFNRSKLEIPDIIAVMHVESMYNAYTGRLILKGSSLVNFIDHISEVYGKETLKDIHLSLDILKHAVDDAFSNRGIVEFIDTTKISLEDYIAQWKKEGENGKEDIAGPV